MTSIADNIANVRKRIEKAAERAQREAVSIKLVAVSKTKPAALIREAFAAGQCVFGENYAQELASKAEELATLEIEWHYIGHLQKNKAKLVAPTVSCIETIDSAELAEVIARRAPRRIPCLIEVNIGDEETKSGVQPKDLVPLARKIVTLANLELRGLMIIPPFDPDPEKGRPYFQRLKSLLQGLNAALSPAEPLRELSMGMSHDLEVAIEEGATIVRIGTAIFGERS